MQEFQIVSDVYPNFSRIQIADACVQDHIYGAPAEYRTLPLVNLWFLISNPWPYKTTKNPLYTPWLEEPIPQSSPWRDYVPYSLPAYS